MSKRRFMGRLLPAFIMITFLLSACGEPDLSALQPGGSVADTQFSLILLSIAIMTFVMLVVFVIFAYVLVRFRQRPGQEDHIPEQVEGSAKLETIWIAIPIILLIILAVPTISATFTLAEDQTETEEGALEVKVTAHQFWWEFEYPEHGIVTAQEMYIPVGEKVQLELTSNDVIHSFWVPALAGKTDTNPGDGNVNAMYFDAHEPGVYMGKCAELCGASHAFMDFRVVAVEEDEFEEWVTGMTEFTAEPSTEKAEMGREIFEASCIQCHATDEFQSGMLGPNLIGFADRDILGGILENNEEELARWIAENDEIKPGNLMGPFDLEDEEMDALVEYLMDLELE